MSDVIDAKTIIHGFCAPEFEEVRREFERNFEERGEIGAAVSICIEGETVVDLWGGQADREKGLPWNDDTIVTIFSCTKGLSATCIHMLIDRGLLDVNEPVAKYWPEFAANGKENITVGMLLSHQAGLPFWEDMPPLAAVTDLALSASLLAAQKPVWEPGTSHGYHGATIGTFMGELMRRIDGRTIGTFFREEVVKPLGVDAWMGLPESEDRRVAKLYPAAPDPRFAMYKKFNDDPDWHGWKMIKHSPHGPLGLNSRERHAAEIPAGGGITNARSLARIYAPLSLDGSVDGVRLVDPKRLPGMSTVRSASDCDAMLRVPTTFTLGFSKTWGARRLGAGEHVIIGAQAFGTPGLGGNLGFADGQARMSFGYTMNKHGGGTGMNDRGQSLVDAAYRAVGFTSSEPGFWVK